MLFKSELHLSLSLYFSLSLSLSLPLSLSLSLPHDRVNSLSYTTSFINWFTVVWSLSSPVTEPHPFLLPSSVLVARPTSTLEGEGEGHSLSLSSWIEVEPSSHCLTITGCVCGVYVYVYSIAQNFRGRKHSRISRCWSHLRKFPPQNLGVLYQPMIGFSILWKFSPSKVSRYTVCLWVCMYMYTHFLYTVRPLNFC